MTRRAVAILLALAFSAAACGGAASRSQIPPGTAEADKFLFTRGEEEYKERNWLRAREYYRQIVDNYPQSSFRPDAKLAVGDTFIADYAQYRLAYAYSQQMLAADRDQSATRDVIKELQVFLDRYPNSPLMPEARKLMREARDRLSESSYRIGFTYFRMKWYVGAIDRFKEVLDQDPEYTHRDSVYFYLAESLRVVDPTGARKPEALPYYERLLKEFEQSEHLEDAKKRISELKAPS
jgi:outer membrane protein assembly factor BamD